VKLLARILLVVIALIVAPRAYAQAPDDEKKSQARTFFESGLAHFDRNEWSAALADFLRSRELYPTRVATINAAVCLRKEGRFDQALELDEEALRSPDIDAQERAFVEKEIAELRPVVGSIDFTAGEPGASIVVDGRERGTYPPAAPIRIAAGSHIVRVYKSGFVQLERRVEVAGRQVLPFDAKLQALLASGRLVVTEASSKVLTVVVDGVEVGKTPFEGTMPIGRHSVALRGPDDLGTPPADVVIKQNEVSTLGLVAETLDSPLRITPTPAGALVSIDGVVVGHGVWEGKLRSGPHTIEVAEEGFLAQKRIETLPKGERSAITFTLERDVTSTAFVLKNPARISVEIDGGLGLGLYFGGDVRATCTGSCSAPLPIGIGPSVGYRFGDDFPITLRVGLGIFLGSVGDARTGSFTSSAGARYDVSVSESASATYLYAAPELRIGKKLGDHLEVNAGATVLVLAALERARWKDEQPVIAARDGFATFGSQPTAGGFLLAVVPGIGLRYAF
jgi:hypothetical protein